MNTKINLIILAVLGLFLTVSFASCGEDEGDITPPIINLISPADGATIEAGTALELEMELSDNDMLKSYKVNIHNAFDGHTHGDADDHEHAKAAEAESKPFSIDKIWSLSENSVKVKHTEIVIPENATPGNYHMVIKCFDISGNEQTVVRRIVIENDAYDHDHDHDHQH